MSLPRVDPGALLDADVYYTAAERGQVLIALHREYVHTERRLDSLRRKFGGETRDGHLVGRLAVIRSAYESTYAPGAHE